MCVLSLASGHEGGDPDIPWQDVGRTVFPRESDNELILSLKKNYLAVLGLSCGM